MCPKRANGNEQLRSDQTVVISSGQCSVIATPIENSTIFHLEDPLAEKPKKRRKKNQEGPSQRTTSNIKASTSSSKSAPELRHYRSTTQAGGQRFSADIPRHIEQQADITPYSEEGRSMQQGNVIDLDNVVGAYKTQREANIRERRRTEDSDLVQIACSQPVANAIIAEHGRTPAIIPHSADANNHDPPAPQSSGLDRPEYLRSPSLLSPPSPEAMNSSATALMVGSGEEPPLAGSTRQSSPPCKSVCTFLSFITLTGCQLRGSCSTNLRRHLPPPM
jgi:hypothetical protein